MNTPCVFYIYHCTKKAKDMRHIREFKLFEGHLDASQIRERARQILERIKEMYGSDMSGEDITKAQRIIEDLSWDPSLSVDGLAQQVYDIMQEGDYDPYGGDEFS